jgi:hypothetical protein
MAKALINERQETMFDTKLSKAADDFARSVLEAEAWKKKKQTSSKILIEEMKRMNCKTLTMGDDKQIVYKFIDAKEQIVIKDYKPRVRKIRRRS